MQPRPRRPTSPTPWVALGGQEAPIRQKTVRRQGAKVGRNAPCPCGSGKKYKKCCGA